MDPDAPFTGVLLLPQARWRSPVTGPAGEPVATIRRAPFALRPRVAIHGADGRRWASGTATAVARTRGSAPLVALRGSTILLRDGPVLTGTWADEEIVLTDVLGRRMAYARGTSRSDLNYQPYDLRFVADQPVLTLLQAIGLAHCLREALRAQRQRAIS